MVIFLKVRFKGNDTANIIISLEGNDYISGLYGNDYLDAGNGNDTVCYYYSN